MAPTLRTACVLTPLLTLALLSCGGDDGGSTTDPPTTGDLRVAVTADGSARPGVDVRLFAGGGTSVTETATTGSDGTVTFEDLEAGNHAVEVETPDGFVLDSGADDRQTVTVSAGSTANASFALVTDPSAQIVEVFARDDLTFSQADLTIAPGTTVRWVNQGQMLHTVTPDGHDEWQEATLASNGETFTHTFETEGTFEYYCQPHLAQGMVGTITVQAP